MATTFLDYNNDKGFYINESYAQLMFHYIYEEAKIAQYNFSNKQNLLDGILDDINGYTSGYLVLMWNENFNGTSDEQIMLQVLQNVKITLQNKGTYISLSELQSIPTEDNYFKRLFSKKPFPASELIKVIEALIQMLQGTWNSMNYDMKINYQH